MRVDDARTLLVVAPGCTDREEIRRAYLAQVRTARVDSAPEAFSRLRNAFELLSPPGHAPIDEIAAARREVVAQPESSDARWQLLSYLSYSTVFEAIGILCDGSKQHPEEFLDEFLYHFPAKVPREMLPSVSDGVTFGRLLLVGDSHATQGRPVEALRALREGLETMDGPLSNGRLLLALRPVFSLQMRAQLGPAAEALDLVKHQMEATSLNSGATDVQTAVTFTTAEELGRLDASFPIDLRQAAAASAKRGDFETAPYEARFAVRLLSPRALRKLKQRLKRETPSLAGVLALDLGDNELRPAGTPDFRIHVAAGAVILIVAVRLAFLAHRVTHDSLDANEMIRSVHEQQVRDMQAEIERDCVQPNSDQCRKWRAVLSNGADERDSGTDVNGADADGGIGVTDLGMIGSPSAPPVRLRSKGRAKQSSDRP